MAIRAKLTTRSDAPPAPTGKPAGPQKKERTEEEKVAHRARIEAAKDALKRSVGLRGDHVAPARSAIQLFLQRLNDPRQPDDAAFKDLLEAPFRVPPKKREQRR